MISWLYDLIIYPIEWVVAVAFSIVYRMIGSLGYTILAVSILINFLVLPMYMHADALQEREKQIQNGLSHWVKHIRRTFRGDERTMLLMEYYRQNGYHPVYSLRSSVSILLEIPFFIAAYRFLSELPLLQGASFLFIRDLGIPDALLAIGDLRINILPFLMTAINLLSAMIYLKGAPRSGKVQTYLLAVFFLILLYSSPAGLVLYWTMNNLFSLAKNLFQRIVPRPQLVLSIFSSVAGVLFPAAMALRGKIYDRHILIFCLFAAIILQTPILILFLKRIKGERAEKPVRAGEPKADTETSRKNDILFVAGMITLTAIMGFLLPLSVIGNSPTDFLLFSDPGSQPLLLVWQTVTIVAGIFLVWADILYFLAPIEVRGRAACGIWVAVCVTALNCFAFGRSRGMISDLLVYLLADPDYPRGEVLLNAGLVVLVIPLAIFCFTKFHDRLLPIYGILIAATLIYGGFFGIRTMAGVRAAYAERVVPDHPVIRLSKNGPNVIVIMLDRAIGMRMPVLLDERPELKELYDGFTWYPNTISYGPDTLIATPSLFGGYEYTPENMNKRNTELLADKQNEALKVLPVRFLSEGYHVTVCDPPYAGYSEVPDLSIYHDYPEIEAYNLKGSRHLNYGEGNRVYREQQKHHFVCYGFYRAAPLFMQLTLYDGGRYWGLDEVLEGVNDSMYDDYGVLQDMSELTEVVDSSMGTLFMMDNETSHHEQVLQLPDYTFSKSVDNSRYLSDWLEEKSGAIDLSRERSQSSYMDQAAALLLVGKWLDHLRAQGVYDNTRIIIVSDHGYPFHEFPDLYDPNQGPDPEGFNPLLMFKDFESTGFKVDDSFMTNADTPYLATKDLLTDTTNPFTGHSLDGTAQKEGEQLILSTATWQPWSYPGTQFDADDNRWFTVRDNLYQAENWRQKE